MASNRALTVAVAACNPFVQRRGRKAGLGARDLVKGPKKIEVVEQPVVKEEPEKQFGLLESKADKVKKLDNLLGGTFTGTTEKEMTDEDNPFLCVTRAVCCACRRAYRTVGSWQGLVVPWEAGGVALTLCAFR